METLGRLPKNVFVVRFFPNSVNALLWEKYEPIAEVLRKLILDKPKAIEKNLLILLSMVTPVKTPCHCLVLSMVHTMTDICSEDGTQQALRRLGGFFILCESAMKHITSDIKIACLELARKLIQGDEGNHNDEITVGIKVLFSKFMIEKKGESHKRSASAGRRTIIRAAKHRKNSYEKKESTQKNELDPNLKSIYNYLLNWQTDSKSFRESFIAQQWIIYLGKETRNNTFALKIVCDLNHISTTNPLVFQTKGLVKWLF